MDSPSHTPTPAAPVAADDACAHFSTGLAFHQAGRLDEAFAAYEAALQGNSRHAGALHHIGILGYQIGNFELALEFLGAAIDAQPGNPQAYTDLGNVFVAIGEHAAALQSYEQALALDGRAGLAWQGRAAALHKLGRLADARENCEKALALGLDTADAHCLYGAILHGLGRHEEAAASYIHAIRLDDEYAPAQQGLAGARLALGRFDEALAGYGRAIDLVPDAAAAHHGRGQALRHLGRMNDAIASLQQAVVLAPDEASFRLHLGEALLAAGRASGALQCFDAALRLAPRDRVVQHGRGLALQALKRFEEALVSFESVLASAPGHVEAALNRGNVLQDLGRIEEALACYDSVLARHGDAAPIWNNRGNALEAVRRDDEALACYIRAIALDPDFAVAHWNRALLDLQYGRLADGWAGYEWRWQNEHLTVYRQKRDFAQAPWRGGDDLEGKTILLFAEQGLGDTLQFCRYAPLVAARGARVVLEVQEPLVGLMRTLAGVAEVIARGAPLPAFDYQCPLMSLPLAFDTRLDSIPAALPYLAADDARLRAWRMRLGPQVRPRVGLAWSGNPTHANDHHRSIALSQLAPLLALDCEFVSLQKEHRAEDLAALEAAGVRRMDAHIGDFADTAALCELVDVVISVDTSIAHLAGALGRPLWVLLPYVADWRWLTERSDTPWYPAARLFRQGKVGDWPGVVAALGEALAALPRP